MYYDEPRYYYDEPQEDSGEIHVTFYDAASDSGLYEPIEGLDTVIVDWFVEFHYEEGSYQDNIVWDNWDIDKNDIMKKELSKISDILDPDEKEQEYNEEVTFDSIKDGIDEYIINNNAQALISVDGQVSLISQEARDIFLF